MSSPLTLEVRLFDDEESAVVASEDAYDISDAVEQSEGRRWKDDAADFSTLVLLVCSLLCEIRS